MGFTNQRVLNSLFSDKKLLLFISFFFIYYATVSFAGYGNDDDTYRMMNSGLNLIFNHTYEPSRFQGYLLPELSIAYLSNIGGFYLSNAASVLMGVAVLVLYYLLVHKFLSTSKALMSMLVIGFNPYFVIVSSSSMDYIYNLFFIFAGVALLIRHYYIIAAFMLAFALSSRLSSALLVFLIYMYFIVSEAKSSKLTVLSLFTQRASYSAVLSLLLSLILYLPVYIASDYSFSFLTHYDPGFGFEGKAARILYYNIMIFGGFLAALIFLLTAPYKAFYQMIKNNSTLLFIFAVIAIVIVEALFIKLPYEQEFLLPLVLLVVPLYLFLSRSLIPAYTILGLTILANAVNISMVDIHYIMLPNGDIMADKANISLVIEPGVVVKDISTRKETGDLYIKEFVNREKPRNRNEAKRLSKSFINNN